MLQLELMREFLDTPRRVSALGILAASLLCGSSALGQVDPDELARRHFESGAAYFEQAEFQEALTAFQKAYELSGRHQILRNISIVRERLGDLAGAVAALDEFLAKEPEGDGADTIRVRRDELRARLEKEKQSQERAPEPTVLPEEPQETAPEAREEPPAQRAAHREREGLPPEESNLLPDEPNLAPAYILLSVGGLSAAGALLTGVVAKSEYDQLETGCKPDCSDSEIATGEGLALTSTILTGVSVVSVAAGVIWWATAGSDSDHAQTKASARPQVGLRWLPGAGYASARFRF